MCICVIYGLLIYNKLHRKIKPEVGIKRHSDVDDDKATIKKLRHDSVLNDIK